MDVRFVGCLQPAVADTETPGVVTALEARGVRAELAARDDPGIDWSDARLTVIRSPWNYDQRLGAFLAWADRVDAMSRLWNRAPVVRWNHHKAYLLDLERAGVPVVPTELVIRHSEASLDEILVARGWDEAVVKPAVSLGSRGAQRARRGDAEAQQHLDALLARGDALVQRYFEAIETEGELSVVVIDGEITHAVRKAPADGDFRVQPQYGGRTASAPVAPEAEAATRRALACVSEPLLYARVDLVPVDGRLHLMELELIEPALYLDTAAPARDRLCNAIAARL